jgi:hypothetical protein
MLGKCHANDPDAIPLFYLKQKYFNRFIYSKKCGGGGRERTMEGMNQTGVHYMHIWKCHNKISVQLL